MWRQASKSDCSGIKRWVCGRVFQGEAGLFLQQQHSEEKGDTVSILFPKPDQIFWPIDLFAPSTKDPQLTQPGN